MIDRAEPGHWEGNLIFGLDRSPIKTLVERSSHRSQRLWRLSLRHRDSKMAATPSWQATSDMLMPHSFDGPARPFLQETAPAALALMITSTISVFLVALKVPHLS